MLLTITVLTFSPCSCLLSAALGHSSMLLVAPDSNGTRILTGTALQQLATDESLQSMSEQQHVWAWSACECLGNRVCWRKRGDGTCANAGLLNHLAMGRIDTDNATLKPGQKGQACDAACLTVWCCVWCGECVHLSCSA
jgi:hypothetical protein